jgi:ParB family transcriptional regulator, chromosome partitioning protein
VALGKVAPALMELYRREGMTLEQLAAFTITDDHAEQVRVWESLPTYGRHASAIRQALSGSVGSFMAGAVSGKWRGSA